MTIPAVVVTAVHMNGKQAWIQHGQHVKLTACNPRGWQTTVREHTLRFERSFQEAVCLYSNNTKCLNFLSAVFIVIGTPVLFRIPPLFCSVYSTPLFYTTLTLSQIYLNFWHIQNRKYNATILSPMWYSRCQLSINMYYYDIFL